MLAGRFAGDEGGHVSSSCHWVVVLRCTRSRRHEWIHHVNRLRPSHFSCAIPRKVA
jgi:hypothetical protein